MKRHGLIPVFAVVAAATAAAAGTGYWELGTREALAEGDAFENVILTADGELRLGAAMDTLKIEGERQVWCLLRARDGALYGGTSTGKILRLEGGKVESAFETGELLVTALAEAGDGRLYAATIPNGKIFRRDGGGKWEVFATPPAKYLWTLLPHAEKHLVAATGPEGKVFTIDAAGRFEGLYETGKENVLSLAAGGDGALYFGTANPGLLFRLGPDGRASVLRDFGEHEVRVIRARGTGLVLGVNSGVKASPASFLGAVQQAAQKADAKEGAPKPAAPAEGGGKPGAVSEPTPAPASTPSVRGLVVQLAADGRIEYQVEFPQSYITDLAATDAGVVVATNNSGRIHRLDDTGRPALMWDFKENQALAFAGGDGNVLAVATGDAAAVHRVNGVRAAAGHYQTKVFDAKTVADWGMLTWRGAGRPAFQSRSGNVVEPDKTWSDWAPPQSGASLKVASPRGRYLQLRVVWGEDPEAAVAGLTVAYLAENQRPRVQEVKVEAAPVPGGAPIPPGGAPPQGQVVPPIGLHSVVKKITWRTEDPDSDPLVFRLAYRPEAGGTWVALNDGRPVGGMEFQWNTESVPDGRYVLRVEASDEPSNAAERALRAARETAPFPVDHRKPEVAVRVVEVGGALRVTGTATDAVSPIARLEVSIDGGDWRTIFPADRIFDDKTESFDAPLGPLPPGVHTVTVRAVDQENNIGSGVETVEVK
jgi:hypothetical protein